MHPTESVLMWGLAARVPLSQPADLQGSDCQGLRSIIANEVRIVATGAKSASRLPADDVDPGGSITLLRHQSPRRRDSAGRRHRRDRERQPRIPSRRPVGLIEFAVSFQIEITLHVADREQVSDLRTDADHSRPESTQDGVLSEVVSDLLIHVSHQADKDLLREKLRSTPVDVKIDTVLVLRVLVLEIVGKSRDGRKFVPRLRIEVGVTAAAIDRGVADAEIGEAGGTVGAKGNVARQIGDEIVDALV